MDQDLTHYYEVEDERQYDDMMRQLTADLEFLKRQQKIDYSLLVGVRKRGPVPPATAAGLTVGSKEVSQNNGWAQLR